MVLSRLLPRARKRRPPARRVTEVDWQAMPRSRSRSLLLALLAFGLGVGAYHSARAVRRTLSTPPIPKPAAFRHAAFVERAKVGGPNCRVLFLGDSLTEYWSDYADWDTDLAPRGAVNFGLAYDTTAVMYRRLSDGELDGLKPQLVVLMVGTNDFGLPESPPPPEQVADGIGQIVDLIRMKCPGAKILLMGILPRADRPGLNEPIQACNRLLSTTPNVTFLGIGSEFGDGSNPRYMPDRLHLSREGYRVWLEGIRPYLP